MRNSGARALLRAGGVTTRRRCSGTELAEFPVATLPAARGRALLVLVQRRTLGRDAARIEVGEVIHRRVVDQLLDRDPLPLRLSRKRLGDERAQCECDLHRRVESPVLRLSLPVIASRAHAEPASRYLIGESRSVTQSTRFPRYPGRAGASSQ